MFAIKPTQLTPTRVGKPNLDRQLTIQCRIDKECMYIRGKIHLFPKLSDRSVKLNKLEKMLSI